MAFAPTTALDHVMSGPPKSAQQPDPVLAIASLGAIRQRRPGAVAALRN
jgi:hypothetical protein